MAHDFAKKRSSQNKSGKRSSGKSATKANSQTSNSQWTGFFWGLLSGIILSSSVYFGIIKSPAIQIPQISSGSTQPANSDAEAETDFSFYEYLQDAEVLVDVVPVSVTPKEELNPVNYLLQAGSFQSRQDAENRRAKIILLNMDAKIVPGIVSGKTWNRVQVGPLLGRKKTEEARDILSANNIDAYVLRMK